MAQVTKLSFEFGVEKTPLLEEQLFEFFETVSTLEIDDLSKREFCLYFEHEPVKRDIEGLINTCAMQLDEASPVSVSYTHLTLPTTSRV